MAVHMAAPVHSDYRSPTSESRVYQLASHVRLLDSVCDSRKDLLKVFID